MSEPVTMIENIDWTGMLQGIDGAAGEVFDTWGQNVVDAIRDVWTNWVEETGTSRAAWFYETEGNSLIIRNDVGYAGYVHRAGTPVDDLEAIHVFDDLVADDGQALREALTAAIAEALGATT